MFTVEYLLRLWVAPEHAPLPAPVGHRARVRYATSAAGIVDLLSVLPFWLAPVRCRPICAVILVLRVLRFLKLARYSPGVHSLLDALYERAPRARRLPA